MNRTPRYLTLQDYLRVLREQRLVILAIALVASAVALAVSLLQDARYEATASIAFEAKPGRQDRLGNAVAGVSPETRAAFTRAAAITEPLLVNSVRDALGGGLPPQEIQSAISAEVSADASVVDITASWEDAELAARLANTFAREASLLSNRRTDVVVARPVKSAVEPTAPVSPKPLRNAALGLLLGFGLGILVAFVRDTLDRRLRSRQEIERDVDLPLLGGLREHALGRVLSPTDGAGDGSPEDVESIRILRQNIEFLRRDAPLRSVLVTSPLPAEGKTTVAASLALALTAAGRSTCLVECDLRQPALAARLGIRSAPGLTDHLAGRARLEQVLQAVNLILPAEDNGSGDQRAPAEAIAASRLRCVTAGTPSPQPGELLGSPAFSSFLAEVVEVHEAVIIDAAPLLPVADALALVSQVDGILLCIRSGQTTRGAAQAAVSALDRLPHRPAGVVVTGLRRDALAPGYRAQS